MLIGFVSIAVLLGLLLYPSFPSLEAQAEGGAAALLEKVLAAHGGAEAFRSAAPFEADLSDQWERLFEAFSFWPGFSTEAEVIVAPDGAPYRARFSFRDGTAWGFDGERPWVASGGNIKSESPEREDARYAAWAVPRLMLLPFSMMQEKAKLEVGSGEGGAPVLIAHFRRPGRGEKTDQWQIYLDPASHRVAQVIFQSASADSGVIEKCIVAEESKIGDLVLPRRFDCSMSNVLGVALHSLDLRGLRSRRDAPRAAFSPPVAVRPSVKAGEPEVETSTASKGGG